MSSASTSARRSPTAARRRCRPTSASSTPTWGRKMALLELHDVRASYGAIRALHGVSLKVEEGPIVAPLGANGARKTPPLPALPVIVQIAVGSNLTHHALPRHDPPAPTPPRHPPPP